MGAFLPELFLLFPLTGSEELFKNAGHQEFAEILWNDGSLTTLDLKSIEKVEIEDNI